MTHPAIHIEQHGESGAADILLCKRILDVLNKHYEGHNWLVTADHSSGHATIVLLYAGKNGQIKRCGCLMHIHKLDSDPGLKKVMMLGGELLERFGLPPRKAAPDAAVIARTHGVDLTGMIK